MNSSGAQIITDWLRQEKVEAVFLVPGLQIDPLFKQLARCRNLQTIVANHEQTAGFMADGYARASQRLGVCAGIGAVGASNMLTAALTARSDDSAVLFLSGNVPWRLRGRGAFQDGWETGTNDVGVFCQALTRVAAVRNVAGLRRRLAWLAAAMRHPCRTPALLSVPHDVLQATDGGSEKPRSPVHPPAAEDVHSVLNRCGMLERLASARRPIVLAGSRAISAETAVLLRRFAETFNVPFATTLSAKGLVEETHPLSLGNFGFGGNRPANESLLNGDADLLLLLGADLSERDSLCWDSRLKATGAAILRIDPKPGVSRRGLRVDAEVQLDCALALRQLLKCRQTELRPLRASAANRKSWLKLLQAVPRSYEARAPRPVNGEGLSLEHVMVELRHSLPDDAILVVDAGLHRVFAGHYWICRQPGTFYSACGLAPMGWGIAAAVGIQLARPRQPVVVLTGDGCMRAHGNELGVMARYGLPILVVVCNNRSYGSIQRRFDAPDPAEAMARLPTVDWVQFAQAFGARGTRARHLPGLRAAIESTLNRPRANGTPCLIEVVTPDQQQLPGPDLACSVLISAESTITRDAGLPRRANQRLGAKPKARLR